MDMLTGYAAAHQHPVNIAIHLVCIPVIMLGVFIPLSLIGVEVGGVTINLAHVTAIGLFLFYLTLDGLFGIAYLAYAIPVALLATRLGALPTAKAATIAAIAFLGGYVLQFVGHAVEKSPPVILKHPLQANLAAPFFTVVEIFSLCGLRRDLFREVQSRIGEMRKQQTV